MKYHPKNKVRENKVIFIVFFLALIILFTGFVFPNILPGRLNTLAKPLWKFKEFTISNFFELTDVLHSKSFLVIENKRLKNELTEARQSLIKTNLLQKENEELKNILGRDSLSKNILARVLSKAPRSPYDTLIIDVGKDKVSKNSEVFAGEGILIGFIDEVYQDTARVKLLSARGSTYEVEIGEEGIPATAEGLGGGNFEIRLPRGVDIEIGDAIISPNLSIKLLGIVEYIEAKPKNSIQKILFKSPVNTNQLRWVTMEIISNF
jgi:cell shape-determining protein MreC